MVMWFLSLSSIYSQFLQGISYAFWNDITIATWLNNLIPVREGNIKHKISLWFCFLVLQLPMNMTFVNIWLSAHLELQVGHDSYYTHTKFCSVKTSNTSAEISMDIWDQKLLDVQGKKLGFSHPLLHLQSAQCFSFTSKQFQYVSTLT